MMIPTGHWNRIEKRVKELWPQNVLEQEKQKLETARKLYRRKISAYMTSGGRINQNHDWVFEFIIRQSLTEIQEKIDTLAVLENASWPE